MGEWNPWKWQNLGSLALFMCPFKTWLKTYFIYPSHTKHYIKGNLIYNSEVHIVCRKYASLPPSKYPMNFFWCIFVVLNWLPKDFLHGLKKKSYSILTCFLWHTGICSNLLIFNSLERTLFKLFSGLNSFADWRFSGMVTCTIIAYRWADFSEAKPSHSQKNEWPSSLHFHMPAPLLPTCQPALDHISRTGGKVCPARSALLSMTRTT